MEIVISFTIGTLLGAVITSISHRLGSSAYEKAVQLVLSPSPTDWDSTTSSQDIPLSDGLYDFQNAEDLLHQYEGVDFDDPDDDDNREPNLDDFKELE